ncbi:MULTISPECIES: hypothetical protein [unclassified Clostridium]|uniref:hypothetical protein n=1 Tax=unclassified Clostridium TaxID=2614128 RepID=UPI0025BF7367|nr:MULTISPECIES: hypothetical protein [unclassified Clostridium]
MTLAILCGNIIRTGAVTLLGDIAMQALDQKDYSRLIKFTGVSAVTVDVVAYIKYLEQNPPLLFKLIAKMGEGIGAILDFFS